MVLAVDMFLYFVLFYWELLSLWFSSLIYEYSRDIPNWANGNFQLVWILEEALWMWICWRRKGGPELNTVSWLIPSKRIWWNGELSWAKLWNWQNFMFTTAPLWSPLSGFFASPHFSWTDSQGFSAVYLRGRTGKSIKLMHNVAEGLPSDFYVCSFTATEVGSFHLRNVLLN